MKQVRIKRLFAADFRKNVRTLYDEIKRSPKLWLGQLKDGETYVFVSHKGNQLIFILGERDVESRAGTRFEAKRSLLDYRGWRIEGGSFDPLLLEDYANHVGLTLGKQTFKDYWEQRYR